MITEHGIILDAIVRANKLGDEGIQIVDFLEPQSAADKPEFILIIQYPKPESGRRQTLE